MFYFMHQFSTTQLYLANNRKTHGAQSLSAVGSEAASEILTQGIQPLQALMTGYQYGCTFHSDL